MPSPTDASSTPLRTATHGSGRCGPLLLHRVGLSPTTPCRSPGALRIRYAQPRSRVSAASIPRAGKAAILPWVDTELARLDELLFGFEWDAAARWVADRPTLD